MTDAMKGGSVGGRLRTRRELDELDTVLEGDRAREGERGVLAEGEAGEASTASISARPGGGLHLSSAARGDVDAGWDTSVELSFSAGPFTHTSRRS